MTAIGDYFLRLGNGNEQVSRTRRRAPPNVDCRPSWTILPRFRCCNRILAWHQASLQRNISFNHQPNNPPSHPLLRFVAHQKTPFKSSKEHIDNNLAFNNKISGFPNAGTDANCLTQTNLPKPLSAFPVHNHSNHMNHGNIRIHLIPLSIPYASLPTDDSR